MSCTARQDVRRLQYLRVLLVFKSVVWTEPWQLRKKENKKQNKNKKIKQKQKN